MALQIVLSVHGARLSWRVRGERPGRRPRELRDAAQQQLTAELPSVEQNQPPCACRQIAPSRKKSLGPLIAVSRRLRCRNAASWPA